MPDGPAPRGSVLPATDRWPALADAFDGALPVVYRYVYRGTGGDAALADDLTAAAFLAAARGSAAGDADRMALGPLHDAARDAMARAAGRRGPATVAVADGHGRAGAATGDDGDHRGDGDVTSGPDRGALRRLPYRQRIVLALRYHDHLPIDEVAAALGDDPAAVEREVRAATAAFLAAAGPEDGDEGGDEGGDGDAGRDPEERLCDLFVSLTAAPGAAYAARLRSRVRAVVRSAPGPSTAPVVRSPPAGSAVTVVPAAPAPPASGPSLPAAPVPALAAASVPAAGPVPPTPAGAPVNHPGTPGDEDDSAVPLLLTGLGDGAGRRRVRTAPPRRWGLPIVAVTALVLLVAVLTGGGRDGRDRAAAPPAPAAAPGDGVSRAGAADSPEARMVGAVAIPSAATVGGAPPAPTTSAEVVQRVSLGPGGPYMNGPYALDSGDEGLWTAAVGPDGTWRAVRIDPATGATLAEIRIPGRIPSDRSHHGIVVSGGSVWTPALRDGLFRIDAATNTPSGIVAVQGGVVGAAMDGGDGAVWAVGNDNVLRRFDARTTEVTSAAMVPEMGLVPSGVDVAYGGGTVWVTVADAGRRHLLGFDPTTLERRYHYVLGPLGLVGDAYELAADGDRVVITEAWPGGLTVVDGAAGRVVAQHRFATAGIAVEGDRAWIMSPRDGRATVVWTRTGELIASAGLPEGVETMVPTRSGGIWAAVPSTGELVRLRFGG